MRIISTVVYVLTGQSDYTASTRITDLPLDTKGSDFVDQENSSGFEEEKEQTTTEKTSNISYGILMDRIRVRDPEGHHPCVYGVMPIEDSFLENQNLKKHLRFKVAADKFARLESNEEGEVIKIYVLKGKLFEDLPMAAIGLCFFSGEEGRHPQTERLSNRPTCFNIGELKARISYYTKEMFERDKRELSERLEMGNKEKRCLVS